jgi:hypothetical protein
VLRTAPQDEVIGGSVVLAQQHSAPPFRQVRQSVPIAIDHRLFLGARPTLDLALCCNCVGDGLKMLGEDQRDGTPRCCVAAKKTAQRKM